MPIPKTTKKMGQDKPRDIHSYRVSYSRHDWTTPVVTEMNIFEIHAEDKLRKTFEDRGYIDVTVERVKWLRWDEDHGEYRRVDAESAP